MNPNPSSAGAEQLPPPPGSPETSGSTPEAQAEAAEKAEGLVDDGAARAERALYTITTSIDALKNLPFIRPEDLTVAQHLMAQAEVAQGKVASAQSSFKNALARFKAGLATTIDAGKDMVKAVVANTGSAVGAAGSRISDAITSGSDLQRIHDMRLEAQYARASQQQGSEVATPPQQPVTPEAPSGSQSNKPESVETAGPQNHVEHFVQENFNKTQEIISKYDGIISAEIKPYVDEVNGSTRTVKLQLQLIRNSLMGEIASNTSYVLQEVLNTNNSLTNDDVGKLYIQYFEKKKLKNPDVIHSAQHLVSLLNKIDEKIISETKAEDKSSRVLESRTRPDNNEKLLTIETNKKLSTLLSPENLIAKIFPQLTELVGSPENYKKEVFNLAYKRSLSLIQQYAPDVVARPAARHFARKAQLAFYKFIQSVPKDSQDETQVIRSSKILGSRNIDRPESKIDEEQNPNSQPDNDTSVTDNIGPDDYGPSDHGFQGLDSVYGEMADVIPGPHQSPLGEPAEFSTSVPVPDYAGLYQPRDKQLKQGQLARLGLTPPPSNGPRSLDDVLGGRSTNGGGTVRTEIRDNGVITQFGGVVEGLSSSEKGPKTPVESLTESNISSQETEHNRTLAEYLNRSGDYRKNDARRFLDQHPEITFDSLLENDDEGLLRVALDLKLGGPVDQEMKDKIIGDTVVGMILQLSAEFYKRKKEKDRENNVTR